MSQLSSTMEQDRAAGGLGRRKLRTKSGDIVVVSLAINSLSNKMSHSVTMRFKMGGLTVSRSVGQFEGETRFEILKKAPRANMTCCISLREISEQRGPYDEQPATQGPNAFSQIFNSARRIARRP